jgi:hypothetical protein
MCCDVLYDIVIQLNTMSYIVLHYVTHKYIKNFIEYKNISEMFIS